MSRYAQIAVTGTVRRVQHDQGSGRAHAAGPDDPPVPADVLGAAETDFLTTRDGFYLATVGETGWPYVQYRGGPPGFVHVLDEHTFAFADVRGNRQYLTTGNLLAEDRVAVFFMDYPTRTRLKIFGRARVLPADDPLAGRFGPARTDGRVERLMVVAVEGLNWNCRQHITPRYSEAELAPTVERMETLARENDRLQRENRALRDRLAAG